MTGLCQEKDNLNHVCLLTKNWKTSLVKKRVLPLKILARIFENEEGLLVEKAALNFKEEK